MPIVSARGQAEVAREQRVGGGRRADREDQERREGADLLTYSFATRWRLRRIWRPSATMRGHRAEVAAHEHEVGHALGHLRAAALRDRQPRRLERRHVVDAVADHRHVAAPGRAAPRPRAACPRARSARRRRLASAPRAARPGRPAAALPSTGGPASGMPASRAIAATVSGASPESTFSSTPWERKYSTVARASGRSRSARTTHAERLAAGRRAPWASASERPGRRGEGEHAAAARLLLRDPLGERAEREQLRRARARSVRAVERERAPAPAGGERDLGLDLGGLRRRTSRAIASSVALRAGELAA